MNVTARVKVTIEFVGIGGAWDESVTMAQVRKQASDDALHSTRNMVQDSRFGQGARIVGEPQVTAVLVDDEVSR